ncbi:hypothetical protein K7J14_16075 [Treponema zuelzerae]|uniref:Uncharacterized protein n=1 Tax=Teretinema zuelzerae TaxID=156 RepID=A0AAE3EKM6_9SPIR|nr:hypothetical protein [Teretinema zuelzerae]MCD1656212.1 hypothetical protein [Teretinema zuelzerae]
MKNTVLRVVHGVCLLVFFCSPLRANAPVIDMAHILETVHNGYQMYQSVLNSIKQVEYAYVTTQAQLKQLQQLDMSEIKSFSDAVSYVDKQIDFVRKTENRFKAISVEVGGKKVPISQFYRLPGEAIDMVENDMTSDMSDWEKQERGVTMVLILLTMHMRLHGKAELMRQQSK